MNCIHQIVRLKLINSNLTIYKQANQKENQHTIYQVTTQINLIQINSHSTMGSQPSSTSSHKYLSHPLFGQVQLHDQLPNYHSPTISLCHILPDPTPLDRWLNSLGNNVQGFTVINDSKEVKQFGFQKGFQHQKQVLSCLMLPIKYSWKKQGYFGQGGVVKVHFQAFNFTLQQEIQNRLNQNKYFMQTDLWFLLYKLVELECHFQNIHKKIGNIHPKNILMNSNEQLKVFSKYSCIQGIDNYEEKSHDLSAKAFLGTNQYLSTAPQQMQGINNRNQLYLSQNENISEMFSIGVTILCAAMLCTGEGFYTVDEGRNVLGIRYNQVQQGLKSLQQRYSSFLYNIVASMLKLKPQQRISAPHVYLSLKEYERQILGLQQFLPNSSKLTKPHKLKQLSLAKTKSQFDLQIEGYKRDEEFRQSQQRRLREFYQRFNL